MNAPAAIKPDHLAGERLLPAVLVQHPLQRETARHVVRVALDLHRRTLTVGGPLGQLAHPDGPRSSRSPAPTADSSARWQTRSG